MPAVLSMHFLVTKFRSTSSSCFLTSHKISSSDVQPNPRDMAEQLKEEQIGNLTHETTVIRDHIDLDRFEAAIEGMNLLTFDAEGVDLSRIGQATILSIGVLNEDHVQVFVFDLLQKDDTDFYAREIGIMSKVLEDPSVIKIIHDCREDSDALNTFHNIRLTGVFDTSIYNMRIKGVEKRDNLNNTLSHYGCDINSIRNKPKGFYDMNPTYWADRPLTEEQIEWAGGDVASLFKLRERLLEAVPAGKLEAIQRASEYALSDLRSMGYHTIVKVAKSSVGKVIGKMGCNIQSIEDQSGAFISNSLRGFLVVAGSQASLNEAKDLIERKANQSYHRHSDYH